MMESIGEKVSIVFVYQARDGSLFPRKMQWKNREYRMTKLGYHHAAWQGKILMHYFHVTDGSTDFRLCLNTQTLHWVLEYVSYGT